MVKIKDSKQDYWTQHDDQTLEAGPEFGRMWNNRRNVKNPPPFITG